MLKNDQLAEWDRQNFFHPSTHLAQHARGDAPSRIITDTTVKSALDVRLHFMLICYGNCFAMHLIFVLG